jgi:glycosyltransferase involved in cell wall biosynthesis
MSLVLVSFTPLESSGGVPRFNRDLASCFHGAKHFSWWDFPEHDTYQTYEWDRAKILSRYLLWTKKVKPKDVVVADSFWADGFDPRKTVCVRHGIWSHSTKDDVDSGKAADFPLHHAAQVAHTKRHLAAGGKLVAVSDFVSEQMTLQWNFPSTVINNSIDLNSFKPPISKLKLDKPLVIHGVTNANKGFEHIEAVKDVLGDEADVLLLDDAARKFGIDKYEVLGNATMVVQPSAYEGNSFFVLECLACDVPIVAYNVGLLHSLSKICKSEGDKECCVGAIIDRKYRSPKETAKVSKFIFDSIVRERSMYQPRKAACHFSKERFSTEWESFLKENYGMHFTS